MSEVFRVTTKIRKVLPCYTPINKRVSKRGVVRRFPYRGNNAEDNDVAAIWVPLKCVQYFILPINCRVSEYGIRAVYRILRNHCCDVNMPITKS
jgi:hypothetical protein